VGLILFQKEDILKNCFVHTMGSKTTLDPIDFHCMDQISLI